MQRHSKHCRRGSQASVTASSSLTTHGWECHALGTTGTRPGPAPLRLDSTRRCSRPPPVPSPRRIREPMKAPHARRVGARYVVPVWCDRRCRDSRHGHSRASDYSRRRLQIRQLHSSRCIRPARPARSARPPRSTRSIRSIRSNSSLTFRPGPRIKTPCICQVRVGSKPGTALRPPFAAMSAVRDE